MKRPEEIWGEEVREALLALRNSSETDVGAGLADDGLKSLDSLLGKIAELREQLTAQHNAVNEAALNWRKIGYDAGYSEGFNEALSND